MKLKNLSVGVGLDFSQLETDIRSVGDRLTEFGKGQSVSAAEKLRAPAAGTPDAGPGGATDPAGGAALIAARISGAVRSAVQSAQQPLASFAAGMSAAFDRTSGTIVTAMRRADAAAKFPAFDLAISKIKNNLADAFRWGFGASKKERVVVEGTLAGVEKAVNRLTVVMKAFAASFTKAGVEAAKPSEIVREMGGGVVKATTLVDKLAASWSKLKGLGIEPAAIPKSKDVPGVGRAIPLANAPAPAPKKKKLIDDEATAGANLAIEAIVKATGMLARGLDAVARRADDGFGRITARGTKAGEVLRALDIALGPVNQFKVLAGVVTGVSAAVVKMGQSVFRSNAFFSSLGDVAGKTFSQIYAKSGGISGVIGKATGSVLGLSKALVNVGTLGVFRRHTDEATKFRGTVASLPAAVNKTTASFRSLGVSIAAALGSAGLVFGLVKFLKDGVKGASDLAETMSKVNETFGKSGSAVTAQADEMAKKFGLVKGPMLDAAASLGLIGKGAGYTDAEAAKMANTMAKLAADTGSLFNIPMAEVLEKIKAGLSGESKPLKDLGVLMNEDAVKAMALSMGLARAGKEVSESAKVKARAAIIERGLAVASGDLERTAGGAANQFRKAGGGISNFATSIGELLLPAVTVATEAFNELLTTVVEVFEANKPMIQSWADKVKSAVEVVGLVLRNLGTFWKIAQLRATEAIANMLAVFETIPGNLAIIGKYVAENWSKLILDGLAAVGTGVRNLAENLYNLGAAFVEFFKDPTKGFSFTWKPLLEGFKADADSLPAMIKPAWVSMQAEIDKLSQEMADKEAKRAANMAKVAPRKKPDPLPDKKDKEKKDKLAGVAELGSKEAYTSIAKFAAFGKGGPDKTQKEHLEVARRTLRAIERGGVRPRRNPSTV